MEKPKRVLCELCGLGRSAPRHHRLDMQAHHAFEGPAPLQIPPGAILIEDWSVGVCENQKYLAPERVDHLHLRGFSTKKRDHVITSRIVAAEGRVVTTASGSQYFLGKVETEYAAWIESR
jgi:hypothetical protein